MNEEMLLWDQLSFSVKYFLLFDYREVIIV